MPFDERRFSGLNGAPFHPTGATRPVAPVG